MAGKTSYKNDWQKNNCERISLVVKKGRKAELQAHAQNQGESLNGFISRAIDRQIERDTSQKPTGVPVRAASSLEGIITPDVLKAAQKAAQENGEGIPSFMARAVGMEVKHDKAAWSLGFNPVTGEKVTKGDKNNE